MPKQIVSKATDRNGVPCIRSYHDIENSAPISTFACDYPINPAEVERNLSLPSSRQNTGGTAGGNNPFLTLSAHMKKRQLFLKWCLTNMLTLAIIFLATGFGATQTSDLSLVGKVMVFAIVGIYFITTIYGGFISWRTDKVLDEIKGADDDQSSGLQKQLADLNHKADHISFAANECPYIGLLGAITGIYFFMTGSAGLGGVLDSSHIKEIMSNSLTGLGIAFIPTITGVFFRSVLSWQHHLIAHEVMYFLKGN